MTTVVDVLKTIADGKSLVLFNTIAVSNCDSDLLKSKVALTRKQYYSRLSAFINAGIVKRERGKYSLTTFGKVLTYFTLKKLLVKLSMNTGNLKR